MENMTPILSMENIEKSFNRVPVLEKVNLTLNRGEIVGLMGENGAGKSTLIKILCGVYPKDGGDIILDGKKVNIKDAEDAQKLGIRTIYQELSLFPTMTIAENIFMHNEIGYKNHKGLIMPLDIKGMNRIAHKVLNDRLSVDLDVTRRIEEIPLAQRQLVEIARAVYSDASIIIMDEPTTTLETKEKEQLFKVMRDLKAQGKAIIFISHHLDEVMSICDRVVVLRDGHNALDERTSDINMNDLISAMIGKSVENQYPKVKFELGGPLLEIKNLSSRKKYEDISFTLHEKEIIGIVGLEGCGKNEILRTLFGLCPHDAGEIVYKGKGLRLHNIRDAMNNRFAFLPGERKVEGIFPIQSMAWNTTIASMEKILTNRLVSTKKETAIARKCVEDFSIKVNTPSQLISRMSGGNQQKVMLARWMQTNPDILLLEEPTRGIDVNAKTEVYKLITQYVQQGKGVVMVSSEEEEVLGICDKVIVVRNGKINKVLDAASASLEEIKYYSVNDSADDTEGASC